MASPPPAGPAPRAPAGEGLAALAKPVVGVLANVAVLTALLVYFGWRRSATQADQLGLTETIFALSTQDYLLRSVRPVLVLLLGVAVVGVLWVLLDRWLRPRIPPPTPGRPVDHGGAAWWVVRLLGVAWVLLPLLVWVLGFLWRPLAYVLWPASIGVGVLLLLYAAHLRGIDAGGDEHAHRRVQVLRASGAVIAGVCVFWTAANYAYLEGVQLARSIDADVEQLPAVVLHTTVPLHLEAPGVTVQELAGAGEQPRWRYAGLRLLEHADGRFFLVSDGWSRRFGVVLTVDQADPEVRVEFLRGSPPGSG